MSLDKQGQQGFIHIDEGLARKVVMPQVECGYPLLYNGYGFPLTTCGNDSLLIM